VADGADIESAVVRAKVMQASAMVGAVAFRGSVVQLQTLAVEISPRRIATVLLSRAERGNAFNQAMLNELTAQLAALAGDDNVRLLVLRGGGKHFCTGADLAAREADAALPGPKASLVDVLAALDGFPKPTVAVVHGGAIGGGAGFAACCDVVLATENAFFSIPEVRVGMAALGVTPFLIRAMGHRSFRRYGLSGERIPAAEALRIGLVHELCDSTRLDDALARITDDLLHGAPGAIRDLKAASDRYASPTLASVVANKPAHPAPSAEAREGIAAFREKRKPSWYPQ
jgi:methylglutaconyl-CoA hydratase